MFEISVEVEETILGKESKTEETGLKCIVDSREKANTRNLCYSSQDRTTATINKYSKNM